MTQIRVDCDQCKGSGYVRVSLDGSMKCGACGGTGYKTPVTDSLNIPKLETILKDKIAQIDVRIQRRSEPSFYDQTQNIENLHGEALAYEKIIQLINGERQNL